MPARCSCLRRLIQAVNAKGGLPVPMVIGRITLAGHPLVILDAEPQTPQSD